jgi:nicotinate phosphoribosyltransferase
MEEAMRVIRSILDNDLYKFTMQQAVLELYPDVEVEYEFTDRAPTGKMGQRFHDQLREEIEAMADLRLTPEEADFLGTLPFLKRNYISFLKEYRFNPDHIYTKVEDGRLTWRSKGLWVDDIPWEVPTMAAISEVYFDQPENNDGWVGDRLINHVYEATRAKGEKLNGLRFTDFGTRRRRSFQVQNAVVQALKGYETFQGTSNVYLAMKHRIKPIGTMAHEWIMGVSAMEGINRANYHALTKWNEVYKGRLGIALTDTFGTAHFWKDFDAQLARLFDGIRHDSADPYVFTDAAIDHYLSLGIYVPGRSLVYSDGLNTDLCLDLAKYVGNKPKREQIGVAFGIGTHFSNDIPGSPALKIVIKLRKCNGLYVVKFGDGTGKVTGQQDAVRAARYVVFGTPLDS